MAGPRCAGTLPHPQSQAAVAIRRTRLLTTRAQIYTVLLFRHVKEGANLEMLKWLLSQGWLLDEHTFNMAANSGDMDIIKWSHEEQCPSGTRIRFVKLRAMRIWKCSSG
jgi:hypothetical protein